MALFACVSLASCQMVGNATNSTWNYDQHGQDWDFNFCNLTYQQSPNPLYTYKNPYYPDAWGGGFSFLTAFYPTQINGTQVGVTNYVYTVKSESNIGGLYVGEPLSSNTRAPFWEVTEMRMHFPGEHVINDKTYDAEFQIITNTTAKEGFYCRGLLAAISLPITIDDSQPDEWFSKWVGKSSFDLDLSELLDKYSGITKNWLGYLGSDTMPDCDVMCWFVAVEATTIHQSTYDALVAATPNVEFNNRILTDAMKIPPSLYYIQDNRLAPDVPPGPSGDL